MSEKSRHSLDGEIVEIRRGLHIYKVKASPFWRVRMKDSRTGKYIVRSTKEVSKLEARQVAEEYFLTHITKGAPLPIPKEFTFLHFAEQVLKDAEHEVVIGNRPKRYIENTRFPFFHRDWGLINVFGNQDVRAVATKDYVAYLKSVRDKSPTLSTKTYTAIRTAFRKVMLSAQMSAVIDKVPDTPKIQAAHNKQPRTFFRFWPIVSRENDEYKKLLKISAELKGTAVRGTTITEEFRDIIMFCVHGFVRPAYSELYALKHEDISFREDKERNEEWLVLQVRKGKTGKRQTETMPAAATIYRRIQKRYPNAKKDDYIFFPSYENRPYAARVFRQQFNYLLKVAGLEKNETGRKHQVYDLRHTGLAMRVYHSKNQTDLFVLAKNAGTSLEMLNSHYLRYLPLSKDIVANLQSFGD
jgi:hypothetical protein